MLAFARGAASLVWSFFYSCSSEDSFGGSRVLSLRLYGVDNVFGFSAVLDSFTF